MNAVEVVPAGSVAARSPEWLDARRTGVSASEIAVVMGISPFESAFSLYWRKIHGWKLEITPEMVAGHYLEPAVADWWTAECDPPENVVVAPAGLYAHPDRPWQLATPDRLVYMACPYCGGSGTEEHHIDPLVRPCPDCKGWRTDGPSLAVLECKSSLHGWDGWGEPDTDDIPVHYRAQVLWQCDVLGVDQWYMPAVGPGGFRCYAGTVDSSARADLLLMREHGRRFVHRLTAGEPPPVDDGHHTTITALKRLHPDIDGDAEPVEVAAEFAEGYRRARALRSRTDALVDRFEARLRALIGDGRRAVCGGRLVASRSVYDRKPYQVGPTTIDRLNPGRSTSYV